MHHRIKEVLYVVDVIKLKNKIRDKTTQAKLANDIGINKSTLYRKLKNNGDTLEIWEVRKIVELLQLSQEEIKEIFFSNKGA